MANEKIFADGMHFQRRDGAPTFVVGQVSFKVPEAIPFLTRHQNNAGYVNVDIKISQGGKYYIELNTYKPSNNPANSPVRQEEKNQSDLNELDTIEYPEEQFNAEDIPF